MRELLRAVRGTALALAVVSGLVVPNAQARVVHYGPNEGYRPIDSAANLVRNGDFNLDPLVDPANPFAANPNVSEWTISPPGEFPGTRNSNAGVGADGRGLRLGDSALIDVSQTLATVAGQAYQLSFFLAVDGDPGGLFRVFADDALIANLDGTEHVIGLGFFSQYLYDFTAAGAETALVFEYQSPIGDQYLSNVTVLAVPEPQQWALMLAGLGAFGVALRRRRGAGFGGVAR